jgi:AraC family transcriptional regulator of adaptative response/methylated-DNA-[protein]-cysteine methyltransferase
MMLTQLPSQERMYRALVERDGAFEGVFVVGVRTTGIFCRPSCPARKPHPENVEFHAGAREALAAGFRPCKRCKPMEPKGQVPDWLDGLLAAVDAEPARRWQDGDLRSRGLEPARVRRWFNEHHGMTFHAYQRSRRLGTALGQIRNGIDLTEAAYEAGYESPSAFRDAFAKIFGDPPGRTRDKRLLQVTRLLTPLGPMLCAADDEGIALLEFADRRALEMQLRVMRRRLDCVLAPGTHEHVETLDRQLDEYFVGTRTEFDVPLVLSGSEFQLAVWKRLLKIPFGHTRSYADIAREVKRPEARRAVGTANGMNRLAIVIPCHRVVRSDGELSGYGGGVWRKRALLEHELKQSSGL